MIFIVKFLKQGYLLYPKKGLDILTEGRQEGFPCHSIGDFAIVKKNHRRFFLKKILILLPRAFAARNNTNSLTFLAQNQTEVNNASHSQRHLDANTHNVNKLRTVTQSL